MAKKASVAATKLTTKSNPKTSKKSWWTMSRLSRKARMMALFIVSFAAVGAYFLVRSYAITDNYLWCNLSDYKLIPGNGVTPNHPTITYVPNSLSGTSSVFAGHFVVTVRGTDNAIYYQTASVTSSAGPGQWSGSWQQVPGNGRTISTPQLEPNTSSGGILSFIVKGTDGNTYYNRIGNPAGVWTGWRYTPSAFTDSNQQSVYGGSDLGHPKRVDVRTGAYGTIQFRCVE